MNPRHLSMLAMVLTVACRKEEKGPVVIESPFAAPSPAAAAPAPPPAAEEPERPVVEPTPFEEAVPEAPQRSRTPDVPRPAASATPDPNDAIVESGRQRIGDCIIQTERRSATPPASRTVTATAIVIETGTVSRVEIAGAPERELYDCVKGVTESLHFTASSAKSVADGKTPPRAEGSGLRRFVIEATVVARR